MLRFGLLGAGRIGRIHGANVAGSAGARLVAVHDAATEAASGLAEALGAEVRDARAIFASSDIDAILVCTPTDTHAEMIEAGVSAGKAVFCEKPVDLSSDRIRRTLEKVGSAPLMIGFNRRFDPNFAALRARIGDGLVGDVELVTILSRDPSPPPVSYIERSGGLFRDMMIHDFDMARFLLGEEIVSVFAMGSALVDPAIGAAGDVDTAAVLMRTASGKICQISCSRRATYGYDQRIEVHGSKGLIKAENVPETTVVLATGGGITADPVQNFFLERYARAYKEELRHFIEAIEGGSAPSPSGEDGLAAGLLADAADASWRSGEEVKPG
ncbi:inositol 2-dehydrogenase [Aureimonas sp. Leaf454]|uniref:inositol 2-dehydrogenase n=1 Tax=Aureimonas sp. Leaf454 TaxID=1736381 RepID=UPI0006FCC2BB|nr:inositol 2-dehydrogenase [Aureimonas sp. Leaf454]KQT46224.1 inositol 2-dehydrogenase [Aureimonas sp. Leaf454]